MKIKIIAKGYESDKYGNPVKNNPQNKSTEVKRNGNSRKSSNILY